MKVAADASFLIIIHIGASRLAKATTFLTFDDRQASLAQAAGLIVPPL